MTNVAHRPRAIRDQIVDREVRRLELMQRAERRKDPSVGLHVTRIGDGARSR